MASVRHPNVISYLGICTEPACIVTEYCAKGSLTDVSDSVSKLVLGMVSQMTGVHASCGLLAIT